MAALESVEERLVDNAAILGVFSLLTGFLFIIDLLSASKRRKREKIRIIKRTTQSKPTQTEGIKSSQSTVVSDMNGNLQNGGVELQDVEHGGVRIPKNAVKLLPSSPIHSDINPKKFSSNENDGPVKYYSEPPVVDRNELKTPEGRIRSTESFLRSEKGLYPKIRKISDDDQFDGQYYVPAGYVLVPADHLQVKSAPKSDSGMGESVTPPAYAKILPEGKLKSSKNAGNYVIIPIDKNDQARKLQSPTVTTTSKTPKEIYYNETSSKSSHFRGSTYNGASDGSDYEDGKPDDRYMYDMRQGKPLKRSDYYEMDGRSQKLNAQSEDSSDEQKISFRNDERSRPNSRHSQRYMREWRHHSKDDRDARDSNFPQSRETSPYRSRGSSPEKPKSILRFDYGRSSKKENDLYFPKDVRYDSLDSQKIAEDLRTLKEITKPDLELARNLEKENKELKERLRQEKEEKEKLKYDLKDIKKLEKQMKEAEEEKNRRVSEREEQYFGIKDLKQSHKEKSFEQSSKTNNLEDYLRNEIEKAGEGAKKINEKLKEKYLEHESKAAKEVQEYRDLIDERFYFLDEEEKQRKRKDEPSFRDAEAFEVQVPRSEHRNKQEGRPRSGKNFKRSDSDEANNTPSTDEEIKLRVETPGSASYKSEALFWLGNDKEDDSKPPLSPASPGYVMYTAQNWPESPSPQDRFQFNAKEAQQLSIGTPPKTPILQRLRTNSFREKSHSPDFEESSYNRHKQQFLHKGLLSRKFDLPRSPLFEAERPSTAAGTTSSWKKWLQPKQKLAQTKSTPN